MKKVYVIELENGTTLYVKAYGVSGSDDRDVTLYINEDRTETFSIETVQLIVSVSELD